MLTTGLQARHTAKQEPASAGFLLSKINVDTCVHGGTLVASKQEMYNER